MSSFGTNVGTLNVGLGADNRKLNEGIKDSEKRLQAFSDKAGKIALGAGAAFAAAGASISKAIDAAGIQRAAELKLETALRNAGRGVDAQVIKDLASSLQKITTFGDEATIEMASMFATFGVGQDTMTTMIPLIQDMSAGLGMDMKGAALLVGKAMTGQASALSRYGIMMSDTQKEIFKTGTEMEKTAALAEILGEKYGGMAEVMAQTASGALGQTSNALGDVWEQVGFILDQPVAEWAQGWTKNFEDIADTLDKMNPDLKAFVANITMFTMKGLGAVTLFATMAVALPKVAKGLHTAAKAMLLFSKRTAIALLAIGPLVLAAAALATSVAAVAGSIGFAQQGGGAHEKAAGLTGDEGFFEKQWKLLKAAIKEGFEPLTDTLKKVKKATEPKAPPPGGGGTGGRIAVVIGEPIINEMQIEDVAVTGLARDTRAQLASREVSPEFAQGMKEAEGQATFLGDQMAVIGSEILSRTPLLKNAIETFTTTLAQTGSPLMAAGAVVLQLATETESFARAMAVINKLMEKAVKVIDLLIRPLLPLVESVAVLAGIILEIVGPIMAMSGGLYLLGKVIQFVADIVLAIASGIAKVWNAIINGLLKILRAIDSVTGGLNSAIQGLRRQRIDINAINREMRVTRSAGSMAQDAVRSMGAQQQQFADGLNDATNELNGSGVTNAPAGFKVALARFNAIVTGMGGGLERPMLTPQDHATSTALGVSRNIYIDAVNVQTDNPAEVGAAVAEESTWLDFASQGRDQPGSVFTGGMFTTIGELRAADKADKFGVMLPAGMR